MKKIKRKELIEVLESVTPGLSSGSSDAIEQSTHFVFTDKRVFTFNEEILCHRELDIGVVGAVLSAPLLALLNKLSDDHVEISVKGKSLRVEAGNKKASIRFDNKIVLPVDKVEKPGKWAPVPERLADGLAFAKEFCLTRSDLSFGLNCVHITPTFVEAMDNHRACRFNLESDLTECLVRHEAAAKIAASKPVKISQTKGWLHVKRSNGCIMSCRCYLEKYNDLNPVFAKAKGAGKFTLPDELSSAVEKAAIFTSLEDSTSTFREVVVVELAPKKLTLIGRSSVGWYRETTKVDYSGKTVAFAIAPSTLKEIARTHKTAVIEDRKLHISSKHWSLVFSLFAPEQKKKE